MSLKSSRVAVEAYLRLVHDTCARGRDLMLGTGVGRTREDALVALHRGRASLRDMAHKVGLGGEWWKTCKRVRERTCIGKC